MTNVQRSQEATKQVVTLMEERARDPKWVWGMSWGPDFPALDHLTHGIHAKKMLFLMSRPRVGKSAFAGKIAVSVARSFKGTDKVVRIVTLEMDVESWLMRMGCFIADVSSARIESGYATPAQRARFIQAQAELAALPLEFLESPDSIEEIERFIGADGRCGFWVLDHIGILPGMDTAFSTYQQQQRGSIRMSNLCRRAATGLIIGHQNRMGAMGEDKRPTMENLAGADQMAKDADVLIGLYRPDLYVRQAADEEKPVKPAEIIVLKNRKGGSGTVNALYHTKRTDWKEDAEANKTIFDEEREEADRGRRATT